MEIKDLIISDELDLDNKVFFGIEYANIDAYEYFDKEDAQQIIAHLKKVFEL